MNPMFKNFTDRRAFTLMELMIVILIIGILMSGVFMLMGVAAKHADVANTRSKVQRLQNAISGFYATYGTYPPVDQYRSSDPYSNYDDDFDRSVDGSGNLDARACRLAARAQPLAFEYPCSRREDEMVNLFFRGYQALSPNQVYANAASIKATDWNSVKMFKFGLMSFLLPRIEMIGVPAVGGFDSDQPIPGFYESGQWEANNKKSRLGASGGQDLVNALRSQSDVENRAVAKWLPNLEGMCAQLNRTIMNIALHDGKVRMWDQDLDVMGTGALAPSSADLDVSYEVSAFRGPYKTGGGQRTVLNCATVKDSWHQDLYYYSAPPYQSYRVWSAGPDKLTFPPWIPLESLSSKDRETVAEWIKDDIVGID